MAEEDWEKLKESWRKLQDPKFRAVKTYFFSALFVLLVTVIASLFSSSLPDVTDELSRLILENVIGLNGVLFGFTGVMLTLTYRELKTEKVKFSVTFLSAMSFWSYLLSISRARLSWQL